MIFPHEFRPEVCQADGEGCSECAQYCVRCGEPKAAEQHSRRVSVLEEYKSSSDATYIAWWYFYGTTDDPDLEYSAWRAALQFAWQQYRKAVIVLQ